MTVLPESLNKKEPNFWKTQKTYIKAILKYQKIYIKGLPKVINIYIKALKIMLKTGLNRFFKQFLKNRPKNRQILKSPKQNFGRQMVEKVAQMAINRQIWQHWILKFINWNLKQRARWPKVTCYVETKQSSLPVLPESFE